MSAIGNQFSDTWAEKAKALPPGIVAVSLDLRGDRRAFLLRDDTKDKDTPPVAPWMVTFEFLNNRLMRDHGNEVTQTEFEDMQAVGREMEGIMATFRHACDGRTAKTTIYYFREPRFVIVQFPDTKYTPDEYDYRAWADIMSGTVFNGLPVIVLHRGNDGDSWIEWPETFKDTFALLREEVVLAELHWATKKGVGEPRRRVQP